MPDKLIEEEEVDVVLDDGKEVVEVEECLEPPCDLDENLTFFQQYKDLFYFLAIMGIQAILLIIICIGCSIHAKKKAE